MAMTVMVIGAAAVMSMQKTSVTGNLDARKTDMANAIARDVGGAPPARRDAVDVPQRGLPLEEQHVRWRGRGRRAAPLRQRHGPLVLAGDHTWARRHRRRMSPGFDILGRDLPTAQLVPSVATGWAGAQFCVNVRLTWLVPPVPNPAGTTEPGLIRADVRVLWPRGIFGGSPAAGFCTPATAALADPEQSAPAGETPFFHTIYMTTTHQGEPGPMSRRTPLAGQSGFTLIELTVSLVAGLIVALGIMALSREATRTFNEEARGSAAEADHAHRHRPPARRPAARRVHEHRATSWATRDRQGAGDDEHRQHQGLDEGHPPPSVDQPDLRGLAHEQPAPAVGGPDARAHAGQLRPRRQHDDRGAVRGADRSSRRPGPCTQVLLSSASAGDVPHRRDGHGLGQPPRSSCATPSSPCRRP